MSSDIVERLGRGDDFAVFTAGDGLPALRLMSETERRQEAADEIKRLRADLAAERAEMKRLRAELAAERTANRITESHNHFDCAAHMARLRAAIDAFVAEVDAHHQPDEYALRPLCNWCTGSDGSWPCVHRMALDELKEARREQW